MATAVRENGSTSPVINEAQTQALIAVLSDLTKRQNLARRLGYQYNGDRKVYEQAGYVAEENLDFEYYWGLYERQDLAGRIVDMPSQASWKNPPEIVVPGVERSTFVSEFNKLAKRIKLWNYLERLDRLGGIGRFGVMLIGTADVDDDLRRPVGKLDGPDDILYLSVFHEGHAEIKTFVRKFNNPRFGLPESYQLDLSRGNKDFQVGADKLVDWTRVNHFAEDSLADDVYGRPRLKRVLNRLQDLEKVLASTGEAYWQMAVRVLTGKIDPEAKIGDEKLKKLGQDMEEIVHLLRRQFIGDGVDLEWLSATPPNPRDTVDTYLTIIAATIGIPKRVLMGTETGERASLQDERQWHATIKNRQTYVCNPMIYQFIDWCIEHQALPEPEDAANRDPDQLYLIQWLNQYEESPMEKAEVNRSISMTAKNLTTREGDPMRLVGVSEDGMLWLRATEETPGQRPPEGVREGTPSTGGSGVE